MPDADNDKNNKIKKYGPPLEQIKRHVPSVIGINSCPQAAVCIPIIFTADGPALLFEERSSNIPQQPGDICFPGGMVEPGETAEEAAIRETSEELLIPEKNITMIGASDYIHMEHLAVYPFVAELKEYNGTFSRDEVADVFTVPFTWLLQNDPEIYTIESIMSPGDDFPYERIIGGRNYKWRSRSEKAYFYQYGENTIWGITAKILKSFLDICNHYSQR